jgi:AcrR family transcriptional regulator
MKKKKSPDRRVGRTRTQLRQAMTQLMMEKGYERLTVEDVLERAGIARSTFYAHFRSKDDLLESGFSDLLTELRTRSAAESERPLAFSLAMFEHAHDHRRLYRAHVGRRSGAMVIARVRRLLGELVREDLSRRRTRRSSIPLDVAIEYCVGSLVGVLTWWLDHKTDLSPREIDEVFRALTLPGLASVLG